jgi:hypothetical protein
MNFHDRFYFPILRNRAAEMSGYAHLSDDIKDKILPSISMGKWRNADGWEKGLEKIANCIGDRPYMLDLSKDLLHQNEAIQSLLSSEKNYAAWVSFVKAQKNIIPVVQFGQAVKSREVVQQAIALESLGRGVVFRIRDFAADLENTLRALYALQSPESAMVIIDAGYIRDLSTKSVRAGVLESILRTLNVLAKETPQTPRVLAGTSFPRSVISYLNEGSETSGKIDILENIVHREIGGDIVMFGDHASIHSVVYDEEGGTFLPRLDVPADGFWHFERRPKTKAIGYSSAAVELLKNHEFLGQADCWGAEMIRNTADQVNDTINAPVTAIAVRVNLHINYQVSRLDPGMDEEEEEDDDWDI